MLYKRPGTPYWWVRFRIRGREIRRSTGTENRDHAEEYERKLREDAWRQTRLGVTTYTWDEARERWLKERADKRSLTRDREAFVIVSPYFDGGAINEITREEISKLRHVIEAKRKPATVLRILSVIRAVLRACVTWGWLPEAPLIAMPKLTTIEPRTVTRPEFEAIYAELPPHVQPMARFSVETGQRYSAVAKLKWSAVDMERRHAYVTASTSKSAKPIPIPLNNAVMRLLKAQIGKHPVYVFSDHKGRAPVGSVKTAWLGAVKRAGQKGLRWHDLRHTWASWHTQSGTPPIVLKALGGWASLAMVERYSHLSSEHLAQWAEFRTKAGTATKRKR